MSGLKGYKVFYNKDTKKFEVEDFKSSPNNTAEDFTTSWNLEYDSALQVAENMNKNDLQFVHICKDCGRSFWLMQDEQDWFKARDLAIPCRCLTCRRERKANKNKER